MDIYDLCVILPFLSSVQKLGGPQYIDILMGESFNLIIQLLVLSKEWDND